ncbi:dUTP diphosphatase (plasmid) [Burkholderia vietnamiensis]|uniref:dUTP diphosphatase n=1 Tax=Burkholderia vietnamiensis (strain G4 / LMG 22486) TaxID=269482 RepID=A4JW87_BURVG|nr:deoxyuridine 5'-triphosphate nucleotidohydrolase Dut [Burkholderia vietnamiensis G4]MCB4349827.1 dUTP diphosphatase [Burkholderia vietnamiensis]
MATLKIKRLHPDAVIPKFATEGAACFDLVAIDVDNAVAHPNDRQAAIVRTGLAVEIPPGYVMKIYSRSGHGFRDAVRLSNCVGIIDRDYRGEIKVALRADGGNYVVNNGDRVAQAMLELAPSVQFAEVEDLSETTRGEGGFGSTGTGALPADTAATAVLDTNGYERDDESLQCALELVGYEVPLDVIGYWPLETCIAVHDWALAAHLKASDNDVVVPECPASLARFAPKGCSYTI